LAAETIFIADVICIVDETEVILLRISFKFAILDFGIWRLVVGQERCPATNYQLPATIY